MWITYSDSRVTTSDNALKNSEELHPVGGLRKVGPGKHILKRKERPFTMANKYNNDNDANELPTLNDHMSVHGSPTGMSK